MKLPISLLVLTALGHATSQLRSSASSPTTKRELLEGNFGQKTKFVTKYPAPQASPGIQYADDIKKDSTPPDHAVFGVRLPPNSKISDLLSGQGSTFEAALAHHLYSPVSVYNTKFPAFNLFEVPSTAATKNVFSDSKIFKQQKSQSEKGSQQYQHHPPKQAPSQHGPSFSYDPNIGPRTTPFSPSFSFGFQPNFPREIFQQRNVFSGRLSSHTIPLSAKKPLYKFSSKDPSLNHHLQYYHLQSPAQYVPDVVSYYGNQEKNEENKDNSEKESKVLKVEQTNKPEEQQQLYILKKAYHAHPNGAISYASFTSNQGSFDPQPESQVQYKQPSQVHQQQEESQAHHTQPIYVPEIVPTEGQPEEQSLAPLDHEQQYAQFQQQQYLQRLSEQQVRLQHKFNPETATAPQFISITPQQNQVYLNPIRQNLLHELQHGSIPQSQDYQQQSTLRSLPATESKFESFGQSTTHSPLTYQTGPQLKRLPESNSLRFPDHPAQQDTFHILPVRHYTPLPATVNYRHSVKPVNSHPTTSEPQYIGTPKADTVPDQVLQPTTVEPEILSDAQRDGQAHPKTYNQQSSTLLPPQSTLQPLLASPESLQSLSTFQPSEYSSSSTPRPESLTQRSHTTPHHSVQIQQQELHEIHSELAPEVRPHQQLENDNKLQHQERQNKILETTPHQYQSTPSPKPTESSKPDYEIEISSNVDHSQLPKDLQPVQSDQSYHEEAQTQVEQTQPQLEQSHQETHSEHEQSQPQVGPTANTKTFLSHESVHPSSLQHTIHPHPSSYDPNGHFYNPDLTPVQPIFRPQFFSNGQEYVVHPNFPQSHIPTATFPPVQYYGKFAESIFGGFQH